MRGRLVFSVVLVAFAGLAGTIGAQADTARKSPRPDSTRARSTFFDSAEPIAVTLTTNYTALRRDKKESPYRPATLSYRGPAGDTVRIPLRVQTRGNWRLANCESPPLRLNFRRGDTRGTLFDGQDAQKLVVPCKRGSEYDQLVLQELNVYRIHNLVTPYSHRARLLELTIVDSASGAVSGPRAAFVIEDMDELLARVGGKEMKVKGGQPDDFTAYHSALTGVFMYLVGGTDFSLHTLHNIEIVQVDSLFIPMPYDFDWTGIVDAPYARPDPKLGIRSVRERLYRGYCVANSASVFPVVFDIFLGKQQAITDLYRDSIVGTRLEPARARRTIEYIEDFYRLLSVPSRARREIIEGCLR